MTILRKTMHKGNLKTIFYLDNILFYFSGEILNNSAPTKRKFFRFNHKPFINETLKKAIIARSVILFLMFWNFTKF